MARRSVVIKPRAYPDRRGMGAQSDFIGEKFVPSEEYKTTQMEMVQKLLASGVSPEQVGRMFSVPYDLLSVRDKKISNGRFVILHYAATIITGLLHFYRDSIGHGIRPESSKGDSMALSFATDIRPLFRDEDIECMKPMGIDLDDPAWMCVPANAQSVYGTVSAGTMPPDEPWSGDRVSLFKRWMDAGCPA